MVRLVVFFLALSLAAASDLRSRTIPDWMHFIIAATSLIPPGQPYWTGMAACLPLLAAGIMAGGIGGGDIKLTAACGVVLGLRRAFAGIFLALCLLLVWHGTCRAAGKIRKKDIETERGQAYPLVPFLWAGMLISIVTMG